MRRITGHLIRIGRGGEAFAAFVPEPLPPVPPVTFGPRDRDILARASDAVARLDTVASLLPDTAYLLYGFVRKEALASAHIEGTQSSLSDLLLYESAQAPGVPVEDVRDVSDCVAALDLGSRRIRRGGSMSPPTSPRTRSSRSSPSSRTRWTRTSALRSTRRCARASSR